MRTPLGGFVLELGAFLSLCGMLAILMGVPAVWTLIGTFMLVDLGIILFLGNRPDPPAPKRDWRRHSPGTSGT